MAGEGVVGGGGSGVGPELQAVLEVGGGDVDLDAADAGDAVQAAGQLGVVGDAVGGDVDDDGDAPGGPDGGDVAQDRRQADVLEADGVDHAGGGLGDARLDVAAAGPEGDSLADDGAEALDIEHLLVFEAVGEGAGGRHDGVGQGQAELAAGSEVKAEVPAWSIIGAGRGRRQVRMKGPTVDPL